MRLIGSSVGETISPSRLTTTIRALIDLDLLVQDDIGLWEDDHFGRKAILRRMAIDLCNEPPTEIKATLDAYRRLAVTEITAGELESDLALVQRNLVEATRRASA